MIISAETRKQFEAWAAGKGMALHLGRSESELYVSLVTQNYMDCWMASRAAVVVELPAVREIQYGRCGNEYDSGVNFGVELCREAIEAAGLQVKP